MKKILAFAIALVLIAAMVTTTAAEEAVVEADETITETATDEASDEAVGGGAEAANGIVDYFQEHVNEIISVITLIMSAALVILTKSGLLPFVKKAFAALAKKQDDNAQSMSASADKSVTAAEATNAKIEEAKVLLQTATEAAYDQAQKYTELQANLIKQEYANKTQAEMMRELSNMLYAIVLSSSAPEYVREIVVKAHDAIEAQSASITAGEASAEEA